MIGRQIAIVSSMTPYERRNPKVIHASRKRRIAAGAGLTVQEVNKLLKQHQQMQTMMKRVKKMGHPAVHGPRPAARPPAALSREACLGRARFGFQYGRQCRMVVSAEQETVDGDRARAATPQLWRTSSPGSEQQPERYERVDGFVRMMTGGTVDHNRITRNVRDAL